MQIHGTRLIAAASLAALFAASPALAQKSKDTLRLAINDPFSTVDSYHFPQDEVGMIVRSIYGNLLVFDENNGKFLPELAKSWKRISQTSIEFELRDDIKFHTGNPFTSEDVKHTIDYLRDPKVRIRFKGRYMRDKNVESFGPHKLRINFKKPSSTDLSSIAYRFKIYDSKVHKSLKDKAAYGRVSASTTGVYKVNSVSPDGRFVLERFEPAIGKWPHRRAPIKHIIGVPMPDRQSQLAGLFTGGLEMLRNVTADAARDLKGRPGIVVTPSASKNIMYLTLDAAGRSKNKKLKDPRVRRAMLMAIDRRAIVKRLVAGGEKAEIPNTICFQKTVACPKNLDSNVISYDPVGAKKLMAEAGLAGGFDLLLNVFAPIKQIAEAISGDLRKIGIRTKIQPLPLMLYVKKRGRGEFTAFTGYYPTSAQPDLDNLMNFFFGANRDYYKDPIIHAAAKAGSTEFNLAKRTQGYVPALNQVNKMAYILPISELPIVFAHTKDVYIKKNTHSAGEIRISDFFWK